MPFTVMVADNFHYVDEEETYKLGSFETLESAIDSSKNEAGERFYKIAK